ncbi:HXXEE domain-containing protein [Pseudosulfitobacter sp. SM2401]|uniref:HXXEE domain-containing protein n=1 Tax=Pseudosulfitobacter sp. SM2401 TaxID=3350098 RepID=UPI0036F29A15
MLKWPFHITLLLAPLAYAIHHSEENLYFDFRDWRLRYFADNNALTTEAIFVLLTAITIAFIISATVLRTRAASWCVILFLMGSQIVNAIFHLGATIVFQDFSPGLITGLLVYLPVNFVILRAALRDGIVTPIQLLVLFFIGAAMFAVFEAVGPIILIAFGLVSVAWISFSVWQERASSKWQEA